MNLYLVQHAEAVSKAEDPQRPLSDKGRQDIQRVAGYVARRADILIRQINHSGKTRAEQTAAMLAASLQIQGRLHRQEGLNPNDPAAPVARQVERLQSNLVIVGHLPQLGRLVSVLLLGSERDLLDLPSAGLVCLERTADSWLINWFLAPELC